MDKEALKPILAGVVRHLLTTAGGALVAGGYMQSSDEAGFIGGGMVVAGVIWSWWNKTGQAQVAALLKKVTDQATAKAAVAAAQVLPPAAAVDTPAKSASVQSVVAKALIAAFALSFLLAGHSAMAQPARVKKPVESGPVFTGDLGADIKNNFKGDPNNPTAGIKLTGNLKTDALAVWKQIQSASHTDLAYASLMAGAAGTPASKIRKQCWDAIIAVNEQSNGNNLKNPDGSAATKPDPSMFTDIETAAEIIDNLSPQGQLYTSCSGAAQLFQANVIQFISAAVTGVTGLAKLAPIPGL